MPLDSAWWITPPKVLFRTILLELAEIGGLSKTHITPELNEMESWALSSSKENIFFYQMVRTESITTAELRSKYCLQNVRWDFIWLVHYEPIKFLHWNLPPTFLCPMVKSAALYHVPFKSYSKSNGVSSILKRIIVMHKQIIIQYHIS